MATERTFVAIKPDGVQRGLVGEILGRFERKGFKLVGLKQITPPERLSSTMESQRASFLCWSVEFITSGPVVAMVWEGDGVISSARKLIGATKLLRLSPHHPGRFAVNIGRNVIHGSDVLNGTVRNCLWFQGSELND